MGRDKRPSFTRHGMKRAIVPLALSLAVLLAGCGGHANVQVNSSGAPATGVSTGGSVNVQGRSTIGTLLAIGLIVGVSYDDARGMPRSAHVPYLAHVPELDASRRVLEQDCSKPIEDWSANLRCLR
jgi:hypothetical protein